MDQKLEQDFFDALVSRDDAALDRILADDFTLADLTGTVVTKEMLRSLVKQRVMDFVSIDLHESLERFYGETGVIVGRTTLKVRFKGAEIPFESRYTHVYATQGGRRRLVAAQGTPIRPPEALL